MDLLEQMQLAHRGRLDRKVLLGLVAHQVLLVLGQVALLGQAAPQVLSILGKVRG